jgi:hypothetical protein
MSACHIDTCMKQNQSLLTTTHQPHSKSWDHARMCSLSEAADQRACGCPPCSTVRAGCSSSRTQCFIAEARQYSVVSKLYLWGRCCWNGRLGCALRAPAHQDMGYLNIARQAPCCTVTVRVHQATTVPAGTGTAVPAALQLQVQCCRASPVSHPVSSLFFAASYEPGWVWPLLFCCMRPSRPAASFATSVLPAAAPLDCCESVAA